VEVRQVVSCFDLKAFIVKAYLDDLASTPPSLADPLWVFTCLVVLERISRHVQLALLDCCVVANCLSWRNSNGDLVFAPDDEHCDVTFDSGSDL
jgi:hypothetical protein